MIAPDVEIEDGRASILISSEEGETEGKTFILIQNIATSKSPFTSYVYAICFFRLKPASLVVGLA